MNRIWARIIKIFGGLTREEVNQLIEEKALEIVKEERKWGNGLEGLSRVGGIGDRFYLGLTESSVNDEKILKSLELKYQKNGIKGFTEAEKNQFVNLLASGWEPIGFGVGWSEYGISDELEVVQRASWKKFFIDPIAKSIVNNYVHFTIGRGIKVTSPAEEVEKVIEDFKALNNLGKKEKTMVKSTYIQGEYFLRYLLYDGKVFVRGIKPTRVEEIITKGDDDEIKLYYKIRPTVEDDSYYVKDLDFEKNNEIFDLGSGNIKQSKEDSFIQHIAITEGESIRGVPQLYVVLRYLKYYEDWIIDRLRLNHERAKVVWIKSISSGKSVASSNPFSAPKGGIMLEETPNIRYRTESAKLDARDAKEDGLALLYLIGSGVNMPLHVINQRTSEEVYASLRKADTPFSQMIEDSQRMWKNEWSKMYRFVLKNTEEIKDKTFKIQVFEESNMIKAMKIINQMVIDNKPTEKIIKEAKSALGNPKLKEVDVNEVPISINFPQVVRENPLELAKVLYLHQKMGIASTQTLSEKAGYDWREELLKGVSKPGGSDDGTAGIKI